MHRRSAPIASNPLPRCPWAPLQGADLPVTPTLEEAIGDLPLLLQGDGARAEGLACQAYRPRCQPLSRFAEFMRRGAGPLLLDHERRKAERGRNHRCRRWFSAAATAVGMACCCPRCQRLRICCGS